MKYDSSCPQILVPNNLYLWKKTSSQGKRWFFQAKNTVEPQISPEITCFNILALRMFPVGHLSFITICWALPLNTLTVDFMKVNGTKKQLPFIHMNSLLNYPLRGFWQPTKPIWVQKVSWWYIFRWAFCRDFWVLFRKQLGGLSTHPFRW